MITKVFIGRWKECFKDLSYVASFIVTWVLLLAALVVNYAAALYAQESASSSVTDIILSNIPVFDVDGLFIYGTLLFWIFVGVLLLWWPRKILFVLKSVALFILIRAVFISLTHLGPFPTHLVVESNLLSLFGKGADLFFSGHTGLPVLLALIFWRDLWLRVVFYIASVFFAAVVLLGHLHYSIDVLAAYFITYAIYNIALQFFPKEHEYFKGFNSSN